MHILLVLPPETNNYVFTVFHNHSVRHPGSSTSNDTAPRVTAMSVGTLSPCPNTGASSEFP
jgi:hypothetical protein